MGHGQREEVSLCGEGETLVIMSGLSREDLIRTADSLRPVEVNDG